MIIYIRVSQISFNKSVSASNKVAMSVRFDSGQKHKFNIDMKNLIHDQHTFSFKAPGNTESLPSLVFTMKMKGIFRKKAKIGEDVINVNKFKPDKVTTKKIELIPYSEYDLMASMAINVHVAKDESILPFKAPKDTEIEEFPSARMRYSYSGSIQTHKTNKVKVNNEKGFISSSRSSTYVELV